MYHNVLKSSHLHTQFRNVTQLGLDGGQHAGVLPREGDQVLGHQAEEVLQEGDPLLQALNRRVDGVQKAEALHKVLRGLGLKVNLGLVFLALLNREDKRQIFVNKKTLAIYKNVSRS